MNNSVLNYVQNQLNLAKHRLEGHVTGPNGKAYPKRFIYIKLEEYLRDFKENKSDQRWLLLPGLRGIGKTTVLSQLFLNNFAKTEPLRVLYISLDEIELLGSNLLEVLRCYEQILGEPFEKLSAPVFLFIDEVQYDPKWGLTLKTLYDRTKRAFICCTGSSSVALQTNADVRRRVVVEKLYPLSFSEFQMLSKAIFPTKGLSSKLRQAVYYSNTPKEAYEQLLPLKSQVLQYWSKVHQLEIQNYLTHGTFPFAIPIKNPATLFEKINDLLDKIISKDIENLKAFDSHTIQSIKRLLLILAGANDVLNLDKLTQTTGLSSKITVQSVLTVLGQAELLVRVGPYGSQKAKATKPSKFLFMAPAIRMALIGITGKESTFNVNLGKFLEDAVAVHLKREFVSSGLGNLTYDPEQGGADFILQIANKKQIAIEVGYGKKDDKQVRQTLEKISSGYGITICETELSEPADNMILRLPLTYFLLM